MVQNRTGRAIHAFTATWTYTPPGGKTRKHIWTEWRFSNPLLAGTDAEKFDGSHDGAFRSLLRDRRISGPLLITHTKRDRAVGIAYRAAGEHRVTDACEGFPPQNVAKPRTL